MCSEYFAEQELVTALEGLKGGSVVAVPFGTDVKWLTMVGNGEQFERAFSYFNSQITKAILTVTLATDDSTHNARGAAGVHQNTLEMLLKQIKASVVRMVRYDILRQLVKLNFGDKALHLIPV